MEGQFVTRKCARRELVCIDNTVIEYRETGNKAEMKEKKVVNHFKQIINKTSGKKYNSQLTQSVTLNFG